MSFLSATLAIDTEHEHLDDGGAARADASEPSAGGGEEESQTGAVSNPRFYDNIDKPKRDLLGG